jgi:tetratricopeptide (TPR) repeat protein
MRAIPWAFLDWAVGTVTDAFCGMNIAEGSKPIMADLAIEQVAPACREKYETGLAALERKEPEAAIAVFLQALEQAPGFVACRQALRRAVSSAPQKRHGMFKRIMRKSRVVRLLGEAGLFLHLRPLKGISFAEQALIEDPGNATAHKLLVKAALAAGLPQTALISLDALAGEQSFNRATALELAEASAECGDTSTAAGLYGRLLKENPHDHSVLQALKRLSSQPIAAPNPIAEQSAGFAPPEPPVKPAASTDDAIIKRYETLLVHCPNNAKVLTTLAEAYVRKTMFDKALVCYQRALKSAGGDAPALKKTIAETTLKKFDAALGKLDAGAPDYAAKRDHLENERLEYQWNKTECLG